MTSVADARSWLDRWDRQQEFYMADREERFTVIADVLAAVIRRPDPLIVDLGCGPGSLSVRLLDRFDKASVVAVDADPLLLGLGRLAYRDRARLRFVDADLRQDWVSVLGVERAPDAVVSTTALHWLTASELTSVYRSVGVLLGEHGVFVNGDHLYDAPERPGLGAVARAVRDAREARVGLTGREDWAGWWQAVEDAPELADLRVGRPAKPIDHNVPEVPSLERHVTALLAAGFTEAGVAWSHGDDRVLVGLRASRHS